MATLLRQSANDCATLLLMSIDRNTEKERQEEREWVVGGGEEKKRNRGIVIIR